MAQRSGKWTFLNFLLDLVFPKICSRCGGEGHYFCLPQKLPNPIIEYFPKPKRGWYLDGLIGAASFNDRALKEAIHQMKYDRVPEIAKILGDFAFKQLGQKIDKKGLLVPVPLHPRRLSYRGFNQAKLIAEQFKGYAVIEAIRRKVNTVPQIELVRAKRRHNVASVFEPTELIGAIKNQTIFLVDDVATTGSTLNSAACVLKCHGCQKVFGLVVARD